MENTYTKMVIGKGKRYYTLWSVIYDNGGEILSKKFMKNITTVTEIANKYAVENGIEIDYSDTFRGEKILRKFTKKTNEQIKDFVSYYVKGKYKGIEFKECKDDTYKLWYFFNVTRNNAQLNSLLNIDNDVKDEGKFSNFVANLLH